MAHWNTWKYANGLIFGIERVRIYLNDYYSMCSRSTFIQFLAWITLCSHQVGRFWLANVPLNMQCFDLQMCHLTCNALTCNALTCNAWRKVLPSLCQYLHSGNPWQCFCMTMPYQCKTTIVANETVTSSKIFSYKTMLFRETSPYWLSMHRIRFLIAWKIGCAYIGKHCVFLIPMIQNLLKRSECKNFPNEILTLNVLQQRWFIA